MVSGVLSLSAELTRPTSCVLALVFPLRPEKDKPDGSLSQFWKPSISWPSREADVLKRNPWHKSEERSCFQRIGLREHFQESPICHGKIVGFPVKIRLDQSIDTLFAKICSKLETYCFVACFCCEESEATEMAKRRPGGWHNLEWTRG